MARTTSDCTTCRTQPLLNQGDPFLDYFVFVFGLLLEHRLQEVTFALELGALRSGFVERSTLDLKTQLLLGRHSLLAVEDVLQHERDVIVRRVVAVRRPGGLRGARRGG